jgi:hypothetical protein
MPDQDPTLSTKRPTFDEATFNAARAFGRTLLDEVPELLGIIIVPAWHTQQPDLATGLVACQGGGAPNLPSELVGCIQATMLCLKSQFRQLEMMLQAHDQRMVAIAEEFRGRQKELAEVTEQIESRATALAKTEAALAALQERIEKQRGQTPGP